MCVAPIYPQVGLCSVGPIAHFLGPGSHLYNNPVFAFVGLWSASEPYISLYSKHRIYVPRGQVADVTVKEEEMTLKQGVHNFDTEHLIYKAHKKVQPDVAEDKKDSSKFSFEGVDYTIYTH